MSKPGHVITAIKEEYKTHRMNWTNGSMVSFVVYKGPGTRHVSSWSLKGKGSGKSLQWFFNDPESFSCTLDHLKILFYPRPIPSPDMSQGGAPSRVLKGFTRLIYLKRGSPEFMPTWICSFPLR